MIHDNEQLDSRGRPRVQTVNNDPSETVQTDLQRADIHEILRQYAQVGLVDNLNYAEAQFKDISDFTDFADAMRHAKQAEEEFFKLPSKVREIFNHSVEEWLDAAHDQEKRDALVEAGIIEGPLAPSVAPRAESVAPGGAPIAVAPPEASGGPVDTSGAGRSE